MNLRLRRARMEDAETLLRWRNDPETRAASFNQEPIELEDHVAWLERTLADPDVVVLVAEDEESGAPVAQVRVNREDGDAGEIHVVVAPEARGGGIARAALASGVEKAAETLGLGEVRAQVKVENQASLSAFRAAGFGGERTYGDVAELRWLAAIL